MKHSRTDSLNFSVSTVCVAEMQPAGSCTSIQGHPYLQHILQGMQALNYHSAWSALWALTWIYFLYLITNPIVKVVDILQLKANSSYRVA